MKSEEVSRQHSLTALPRVKFNHAVTSHSEPASNLSFHLQAVVPSQRNASVSAFRKPCKQGICDSLSEGFGSLGELTCVEHVELANDLGL